MSAWMVSNAHIDALVGARSLVPALGGGFDPPKPDFEIGRMLAQQNIRSLHTRYPGDAHEMYEAGLPNGYKPRPSTFRDPVVLLKACACYAYQSCESDDWDETPAADYISRLRAALLKLLGLGADADEANLSGYDSAPWGLE
jgi:hypothetical protein